MEGLLRDATLEATPQSVARGSVRFYRNTLLPRRDALWILYLEFLELPDIEIDLSQVLPAPRTAPVWSILASGLDFWNLDPDAFPPEDLEATDRLLHSSFFQPDEWLRNAEELQPLLGESAGMRIPGNVRVRLREAYRSFILGNYLSAIALARAILEYSLVDRSRKLEIDPSAHDPRHPRRIKALSQIVDDASEKRPHLALHMGRILDAGNDTLHPKPKDKLALLPSAVRKLALSSVESIRTVVEDLYL